MAAPLRRGSSAGTLPVLPPRFALVELAIFASIVVAELLWEPFPDLSKLNPHPFWIAVLLLSLQYGTVSGLLAAAVAIGGSWLIGLPEPEIGESYFNYLVRIWTQPVLWIVVALLLGSFRMRQIEERNELDHQIHELTVRSAAMTNFSTQLKGRVDQLERRLATGVKSETDRLLNAFGALNTPGSRETWAQSVHAALSAALPDSQVSLFSVVPQGLKLALAHGWPEMARWRRDIPDADPLARAITAEARAVSVLNSGDDRILAGDGLFAVPLFAHDTGLVVGMLKIEHLPAAAVDRTTLPRLQVLAQHLAPTGTAPASAPLPAGFGKAAARPSLLRRNRPTGIAVAHDSKNPQAAAKSSLSDIAS